MRHIFEGQSVIRRRSPKGASGHCKRPTAMDVPGVERVTRLADGAYFVRADTRESVVAWRDAFCLGPSVVDPENWWRCVPDTSGEHTHLYRYARPHSRGAFRGFMVST